MAKYVFNTENNINKSISLPLAESIDENMEDAESASPIECMYACIFSLHIYEREDIPPGVQI